MKTAAPARKSIVQLAYELQAAEDRKARKSKKEPEPAALAPKKKPTTKGRAK